MVREHSVSRFNKDVQSNAGYQYTTTDRLSCRLSNERLSKAVRELVDLRGKTIVDIGCGDGAYTFEFLDAGAAYVLGVDAAVEAVNHANLRVAGDDRIHFEACDIYTYAPKRHFQVAVVRGLLHHLYEPEKAIAKICGLAEEIIVLEPNGYNPALKLIERFSSYHVEHEEKSYSPASLDRWFEKNGGTVVSSGYIGLVPFFCPDALAVFLNKLEPFVEMTPLMRKFCCGVYAFRVKMPNKAC